MQVEEENYDYFTNYYKLLLLFVVIPGNIISVATYAKLEKILTNYADLYLLMSNKYDLETYLL